MSSSVVMNPEIVKTEEKKEQAWSNKYIAIGVTACIGGLIFQLITGSLYQWGIINIYVTSYFKTIDPSVTLESNGVAFPIMMYCMGLPMRFGIHLAEITHPMIVMLSCQVLLSLSIFVSSFMTNMWAFIFFYGILFGLLVGSAFMIPIIEVNKYFPGKKNYVNGCILVGTGSGSVVFGMFSYTFLNPNHLKPLLGYYLGSPELQEIASRVPTLLKFLALMYFVFGMVGIAMMSPVIMGNRRKENAKLEEQKAKKEEAERSGAVVAQNIQVQSCNQAHSLKQAFSSLICWIEVAIVLLTACGLYLINGNYKTYVKASINDDYFLTIVGAIGAVANGCSRFLWNTIFLKTGYKTVMLIILGASITVYSTIRFTVHIEGIYLLEVLVINFCIGGLLVTTPTVAQVIFGQKTGSNIYGFYWQVVATANLIQYLLVFNLSKTFGFDNIIYICLGMACLAVPIVILTKFQGPWKNQTSALGYCVGYHVESVEQKANVNQEETRDTLPQNRQNIQKKTLKNPKLEPLDKEPIVKSEIKKIRSSSQANESVNVKLINEEKKQSMVEMEVANETGIHSQKQKPQGDIQTANETRKFSIEDSKLNLKQTVIRQE